MQTCTVAESRKNQDREAAANKARHEAGQPIVDYAIVDVIVASIDEATIAFTTTGEDGGKHLYKLPKTQVYLGCPTAVTAKGDRGALLISRTGLEAVSQDAHKVRIYGSTPDAKNHTKLSIKWPESGGVADEYRTKTTPLEIWPTSIVIRGYANDDPELNSGSVDLCDAELAGFLQSFQLDRGGPITLNLTHTGLGEFQVNPEAVNRLERALATVRSEYNGDARARASAWQLIAQWEHQIAHTPAPRGGDSASPIGQARELLHRALRSSSPTVYADSSGE